MEFIEAVQTAIKYERQVRDAYHEAMKKAKDPDMVEVLESLAHEENDHLKYLQQSYKLWKETGKITPEGSISKVKWDAIKKSIRRVNAHLAHADPDDESIGFLPFMERILMVERETYNFYVKAAKHLDIPDRKFFSRFVQSEKRHVATIADIVRGLREGSSPS